VHFTQRGHRIAEILECRAADDEVECLVRKRQRGGIALAELGIDGRPGRLLGCHADERSADVDAGDPIVSELGKLDREIAGARRHFEHTRARRHLRGDPPGAGLEVGSKLCGILGVPARQHSLPREASIRFLARQRGRFHDLILSRYIS